MYREINFGTTTTDVDYCFIAIRFEIIVQDLCVPEKSLGLMIFEEALAIFILSIFLKQMMSA